MSATSDVDSAQAAPSEEFVEGVKQLLEHLYDLSYLHSHTLRQTLLTNQERMDTSPAQQLQRLLINAVESLNPGNDVAFRAPSARIYNLLHLHYVEDMTVQEAANELGISTRQAYRDLRHGDKSTATVLWTQRSTLSPEPRAVQLSSVESEIERFEYHLQAIDLCLLLTEAQKSVENLAKQHGNQFVLMMPDAPLPVWTDSVVAQQVLTNLLSTLVQQLRNREIQLEVTDRQGGAMLNLTASIQFSDYDQKSLLGSVGWQLAERLGWTVEHKNGEAGETLICVNLGRRVPTILVMDDNVGLVELLMRYLASHACQVISAESGVEGLQLANQFLPDAILLDVMMPGIDGWKVLQILRSNPQTGSTPVIVCSVFNDPQLAHSLGATAFLAKPIRRDNILSVLSVLKVL